jgi:Tfp pilus assembly protein PilZ
MRPCAPNVKRPIEWMGKVTRVITPKRASASQSVGMAVKIFAISDKERIRWTDLLARASQTCEESFDPRQQRQSGPNEPVPDRMHVRYRTPLLIDIRSIKRLFRFVARDISAGGAFIPTNKKLEEGSAVSIVLRHPMSGETFEIDGEVIRSEADGLAVQFQGISTQRRQELQRFIVSGRSPF